MKRVLFILAAVAVLAAGGFALSSSAHADNTPGGGPQCGTPNC